MKISGYHKFCKDNVIFKLDYNNLDLYDVVYISKVFTDTPCPDNVLKLHNVVYGGTGFFFDKAKCLPNYIEHHRPDYHYDGNLYMHLPSGREICYRNTYIYKNKYEQPIIGYWGSELLKDLIQAISRDILLNAMLRLDACYDIVMYTNNEIVIEHATDALYDVMMRMSQYESWMQGLALHVDGFICNYYKAI